MVKELNVIRSHVFSPPYLGPTNLFSLPEFTHKNAPNLESMPIPVNINNKIPVSITESDDDEDDEDVSDDDDEDDDVSDDDDDDDVPKEDSSIIIDQSINSDFGVDSTIISEDVKLINIENIDNIDNIETDGSNKQEVLLSSSASPIYVDKLENNEFVPYSVESSSNTVEETSREIYRKMNIHTLKALVISKGLTSDPSKMKKPELLKLLDSLHE
jgi:hypothetical protein